jgi:transcriptional regulator with XRE-family HTH domain
MPRLVTPLRLAIAQSGLTQREVADAAGLHESRLSRIVNGLHCDEATREAIARALGRHVDEVFPPAEAATA